MAVHTYVVNPLTIQSINPNDVLWLCTGTADMIPFSFTFWQSEVAGMTLAQIKVWGKAKIDTMLFTVPQGNLANFSGGTFTG